MKKMLAIDFFLLDYDVILSYTKQDYWPKNSYFRNFTDEPYHQSSREDIIMRMNNIESSFEENLEVVKKDHDLQQIDELKPENNIFQEVVQEFKEMKIVENHKMEITRNIMEDPT